MNTRDKRFRYGVAIAALVSSLFFLGLWFYGYLGDEWFAAPFDEKSVPTARTY